MAQWVKVLAVCVSLSTRAPPPDPTREGGEQSSGLHMSIKACAAHTSYTHTLGKKLTSDFGTGNKNKTKWPIENQLLPTKGNMQTGDLNLLHFIIRLGFYKVFWTITYFYIFSF